MDGLVDDIMMDRCMEYGRTNSRGNERLLNTAAFVLDFRLSTFDAFLSQLLFQDGLLKHNITYKLTKK